MHVNHCIATIATAAVADMAEDTMTPTETPVLIENGTTELKADIVCRYCLSRKYGTLAKK